MKKQGRIGLYFMLVSILGMIQERFPILAVCVFLFGSFLFIYNEGEK